MALHCADDAAPAPGSRHGVPRIGCPPKVAVTTQASETKKTIGFFAFYVRALRRVPGLRGWGFVLFLLSSVMHSLGHAALALAAGRCAVLLVGSWVAGG